MTHRLNSLLLVIFLLLLPFNAFAALISTANWRVVYVDSQELVGENGAATNAIDGSSGTFWHTQWLGANPPPPHEIQIDLGQSYDLDGFRYLPRQDGSVNGRVGNYEFYVSADGSNWGTPVASGTFANDALIKEITFATKTGRYIRFRALSEVNGRPWTCVAELSALGVPAIAATPESIIVTPTTNVTISVGQSVQFSGNGTALSTNYPLSYRWRFGEGSGVADSTVQNPGSMQFALPGIYQVSLTVTDAKGIADLTPAIVTVTVISNSPVISHAGWRLTYVDSQELKGENGAAINVFDSNNSTIWHTQWDGSSPLPPHEIQIDMGANYELNAFRYLPRQDGVVNGRIGQYEFYVSSNGVNWGNPVASGTFANNGLEKEIAFSKTTGRYIRLRALTEVNGKPWTSVAELNVLGATPPVSSAPDGVIVEPVSDVTEIDVGETVQFSGSGASPAGNIPLSFNWEFGAGAGVPNSTLQNPGTVQFNTPGSFDVTLTVTDSQGNPDPVPAKKTVVVRDPNFTYRPDWGSITVSPFNLVEPTTVMNPVLTKNAVTDIDAQYIADPFIFKENDNWFMFFEVYGNTSKLGTISVATSQDGLHWNYDRTVLSEQWHLSYPQVFNLNGKYYMLPETSAIREVRLYEATNFPYGWGYVSTLIAGRDFVDPSIVYFNNTWWMFVSDTSNGNLYLYYSENLLSGWTEHPRSPLIVHDSSKSRGAGRVFVYNGNTLIRTAQKDNLDYGEAVRAFQVDILTTSEYSEHELAESPIIEKSGSGWNATGMHSFDPWWTGQYWISVVDGKSSIPDDYSIGVMISASPAAPNATIQLPTSDVTIAVGDSVQFAGSASSPSGAALGYLWDFGTGAGVPAATVQNPGLVQFLNAGTYTVTLRATDSNGLVDPTPAVVRVHVIEASPASSVIPTTDWRLRYVDSQEIVGENGAATNAFDGNPATIWHTQWLGASPAPPHEIQIDLGKSYELNGFRYLPRQDVDAVNGRIAQYEFYVSSDGSIWGTPVATGTFVNSAAEKEVPFPATIGRYIRLRALTEVNGRPWTSAAEIKMLGR